MGVVGTGRGASERASGRRTDKTERAFSTGRVLLPLFALEETEGGRADELGSII